jgi:hypothetical protein
VSKLLLYWFWGASEGGGGSLNDMDADRECAGDVSFIGNGGATSGIGGGTGDVRTSLPVTADVGGCHNDA